MAPTQSFHQTAQHGRSHVMEDAQETYVSIPSIDETGQMLALHSEMETPKPSGQVDTWDILWYRLRQGSQNSLINNVVDSASLIGSQDPNLDRFLLKRQKENDFYLSNPNVAQAVVQGNDGGVVGDIAEFAGQLTDPIVVLLVFLLALFIRFIGAHKEHILKTSL